MGSNSRIACQNQTKFRGREVQDDRNRTTKMFLPLEYHGWSKTFFSKIINRGLRPKGYPGQQKV